MNTTDVSAGRAATAPPPPIHRPVTYAEAMNALRQTYNALLNIQRRRLGQQTREQLELLCAMTLLRRGDGTALNRL